MPLLTPASRGEDKSLRREPANGNPIQSGSMLSHMFATCANPGCSSGWLHLLRARSRPVFEGGWTCSLACTSELVRVALHREAPGSHGEPSTHRHRVPLGLMMLEKGWINANQLREALALQRRAGGGRLGEWLTSIPGISEQHITRALGLQWNCPVLTLDQFDPAKMASVLPRLFVEAFGALPLRLVGSRVLYLGFESRLDPVVSLAIERMSGLRVESGLVSSSLYQSAHQQMLEAVFPRTEITEALSHYPLIRFLSRAIERFKPVESRLVKIHDCFWLRMWKCPQPEQLADPPDVEDIVCSMTAQ